MGLKPYDRKISQVFNNVQYDIDFYQREYKWNDETDPAYKPVSSLLKDIFYRFDLEKYNPNQTINEESTERLEWYYLNTFMTNHIKGKKYIVDGQQRLTTLTLISLALYHLGLQHGLPVHVTDSLKSSIVGNTEYGKTYWLGFKDRKGALDDIMTNNLDFKRNGTNISERNIYANYRLIFNTLDSKFKTPHKLHTFMTYFRHRIFLIEIEIDKGKDVAMVFEVINDRGVPLKPYEILKGKLLSQIDIADREKYIDIWEKQIEKIEAYDETRIDDFFGYYFRSKYAQNAEQYRSLDRTRYHKSIFTADFEATIGFKNDEGNVRRFVESLLPYFVDLFVESLKYYNEYQREHEFIFFNGLNDMDGQFLLTMSAMDVDDVEKDSKQKLVPRYFDKFFTLSNLTNSYKSNDFNANIIALNSLVRNRTITEVKQKFDEQLLSLVKASHDRDNLDEPFKYEFFKNVGYNELGKTFLRYFFSRIDHYISDFSDLNEFGTYYQLVVQTRGGDVYHVEHILTNREENESLFADEEEFFLQRNRLGALLLLKGKDNQSSNDELYVDPLASSDKLRTYNVAGTYFARTLLSDMYQKKVAFARFIRENQLHFQPYPAKFGKEEIEARHQLLYELVKRIWE
jgi:uncharacterized protein with ParB-like and HNH nuclease domain